VIKAGGSFDTVAVHPYAPTPDVVKRVEAIKGVVGVVVFQWRDPKPFPGRREIWPLYAGLLDQNGKPKASLAAFEQAATD
jgi:hypothetical protein